MSLDNGAQKGQEEDANHVPVQSYPLCVAVGPVCRLRHDTNVSGRQRSIVCEICLSFVFGRKMRPPDDTVSRPPEERRTIQADHVDMFVCRLPRTTSPSRHGLMRRRQSEEEDEMKGEQKCNPFNAVLVLLLRYLADFLMHLLPSSSSTSSLDLKQQRITFSLLSEVPLFCG